MDIIKRFQNMTKDARYLAILIIYCFSLLTLRVLYLEELKFIFLIWNMFLAMIPFALLHGLRHSKRTWQYVGLIISILFLPNAPYVLTDMIHWNNQNTIKGWFDWQMLLTFGLTGIWSFYLSLKKIWDYLDSFDWPISNTFLRIFYYALFPMMGFGVYLGRIQRYNSWDAVIHPFQFITDMIHIIQFNYLDVILFSVIYSFFLWFTYFILSFKHQNT